MKTYFSSFNTGKMSPNLYLVSALTCQNNSDNTWYCEMLPDWLQANVHCVKEECTLFLKTHLMQYCVLMGLAVAGMSFVVYVLEKQKDKFM